jgi:predicted SAM-dependent methyltransferase
MTHKELLSLLDSGKKIALDLGCGPAKRAGYLGVDKLMLPGVDYLADLDLGMDFLPHNSVDEIYTSNFMEHIDNLDLFMNECHRIVKPGGEIHIYVPHFSNPWSYSDYTHRRFFGLYTFLYFSDQTHPYKRKVPTFYSEYKFHIIKQKLIFKSPPFYFRYLFRRRVLENIFNSTIYMQELYEDVFCYIFPCQELYSQLSPIK